MYMDDTNPGFFKKKLFLSSLIPAFLIIVMWLVRIVESIFDLDLTGGGIYPLSAAGLPGILFSPFIHNDYGHLFNNTLPLFFLALVLFYFYPAVALKVLTWTFFITGLLVWVAGRPAWHIGASGLVYGLASFHFFSGIIRKHFRLVALSLLIVFLYGSMVWGIFPGYRENISWESHMLGFISGVILAIVFRNEGPRPPVYDWMNEDDQEETGAENEELYGSGVK